MSESVAPFVLTRPRRHEEDGLQKAVTQYLAWSLPENACWIPIPNGGWRWRSEAARMVGLGQVRAGCPDLCVIHDGDAIFLELKAERGTLSSIQKQMHAKLVRAGADVFTVRSVDEVQRALAEAGVRLRGHAQ